MRSDQRSLGFRVGHWSFKHLIKDFDRRFSKSFIGLNLEIQLTIKISEKTERRFGVILAPLSSNECIKEIMVPR